ncbi:MAG: beta-Ala-His dipeptidase, partial [Clostridia bacterium]|nr:beta-Ala-His dipeptidase [Clostridia bacterium]
GLDLRLEDGWISANGTTLGGDNGIAVAYGLAILASDDLDHPPLEVVFTSDEEIGLLGAKALDMSKLKGKFLLNLDSESEGILTVSCAGGSMTTVTLPFTRTFEQGKVSRITFSGLLGGHSGAEIHKGRANAAVLAGELLGKWGGKLISARGGSADNAIMSSLTLEVLGEGAEEAAKACEGEFRARYPEENITLTVETLHENGGEAVSVDLGGYLRKAPYGVQAMSLEIEGLVQTSLNVGILETKEDAFVATYSVRSSVEAEKTALNALVAEIATAFGGSAVTEGEYPAWEYRKKSPLRDLMVKVYEDSFGKEMKVEAIHAGLECGLFAGGIPGLDAVSFGPDMADIHTPAERLSVESVSSTWRYLLSALAAMQDLREPEEDEEEGEAEEAPKKKGFLGLWNRRK